MVVNQCQIYLADPILNSIVQFSRSVMSDSLRPYEPQHARPPCPSTTPGVHPNSRPFSHWCHPAISSPGIPPSIFPSIRVLWNESAFRIRWPKYWSFSFNISPSNEHPGLISLGWIGWISMQSKGLSVFSNTTVQQHQFFGAQPLYVCINKSLCCTKKHNIVSINQLYLINFKKKKCNT